jgi:hypothetical protein
LTSFGRIIIFRSGGKKWRICHEILPDWRMPP